MEILTPLTLPVADYLLPAYFLARRLVMGSDTSVHQLPKRKIPIGKNNLMINQTRYKVERYQNCKYKNSPYHTGADIWKSLPLDISNSIFIFHFKTGLKTLYKKYKNDD